MLYCVSLLDSYDDNKIFILIINLSYSFVILTHFAIPSVNPGKDFLEYVGYFSVNLNRAEAIFACPATYENKELREGEYMH